MDDIRVLNIWNWCSESYLRQGRRLSLPTNTDPAKTYQWRYATAIAKKFDEWGLPDDAAKKFIDIAVGVAKEKGLLNKGLAILHQTNMLALCYEKLQTESVNNSQTLDSLQFVRDWLQKKSGDGEMLDILLGRSNPEGFCNLTMWFQASRIPPLYITLSRACSRAMARLNRDHPDERSLLPKQTELYLLREKFLKDQGNVAKARQIFVHDWREPCLLPS